MDYDIGKRDWSDWVLGLCVVGGLVALGWLGFMTLNPEPEPGPEAARTIEAVAGESARPPPRPGYIRAYECKRQGYTFVSDQPCGPDAVEREVEVKRLTPAAPSSGVAAASDPAMCAAIRADIDQIEKRIRSDSPSAQGAYWGERLRAARSAYDQGGCGN